MLDTWGFIEFIGCFNDEFKQISAHAKRIAVSRIRYKLNEIVLIKKLIMADDKLNLIELNKIGIGDLYF